MVIDLNNYVIKGLLDFNGIEGRVRVKHYSREPFLKGPIPLSWLVKAGTFGKSALMVGLVLWYMDGMKGEKTFRMGRGDIAKLLGVSQRNVLRGIKGLEKRNLIFVLREPGQKLIITMNRKSAASEATGKNEEG